MLTETSWREPIRREGIMASDRGYDFDAAYVLMDLLQRVEPGAVAGALLAEAREISSGSSELAMLEQSTS